MIVDRYDGEDVKRARLQQWRGGGEEVGYGGEVRKRWDVEGRWGRGGGGGGGGMWRGGGEEVGKR